MFLLSFFVRVFVTFRKLFYFLCLRYLFCLEKKFDYIVNIYFLFFIIAYAFNVARQKFVATIIALKSARLYILFFNYIFDL